MVYVFRKGKYENWGVSCFGVTSIFAGIHESKRARKGVGGSFAEIYIYGRMRKIEELENHDAKNTP